MVNIAEYLLFEGRNHTYLTSSPSIELVTTCILRQDLRMYPARSLDSPDAGDAEA